MKCPGADPRYLEVYEEKCKNCGYTVEVFSDELKVTCPRCKKQIYRETMPSCIEWCSAARECIGAEKYDEIMPDLEKGRKKRQAGQDFKEKILAEMVGYFGDDINRIGHAIKVTYFAEKILKGEAEGDRKVVVTAAILHDIGIKECERKYGSANGQLQEQEGPPVARELLEKVGIREEVIDEVCLIIACHHSPGELDTVNFGILWDADCMVNFEDMYTKKNADEIKNHIEKTFLTPAGRKIAKEKYLR
jgi:CRISPR/Cas system-associated endonuclease Cas3-HD/predicted RNA-binding Zn-ribbon protein involved in translation (DUF1610 family)